MSDSAATQANGEWRSWGDADARRSIRAPMPGDDKYSRGVVGVLTGSTQYPGAAVLGVEAAGRAGAGMIRYLGPERAETLVLQRRPEVVTGDGRVQAWLVGSGMAETDREPSVTAELRRVLAQPVPAVIDAGALDLVDGATGPVVLTPHYRELARLLTSAGLSVSADDVSADAAGWAVRAAEHFSVTVLLKGHTTWVAGPGVRIRVAAGPAWLATAGSGDVLGGILGAFVAANAERIQGEPSALAEVAASAVHVHGRAGARASAGGPLLAFDIAGAVPGVIAELLTRA